MQIVISSGQGLHHLLSMFVLHPTWWDLLKPGLCLAGFLFVSLLLLASVFPLSFPIFCLFLQHCPVFWVLSLPVCPPHSSAFLISIASFGWFVPRSQLPSLLHFPISPSSLSKTQISLHRGGFPREQRDAWSWRSSHQHLYTLVIKGLVK